MQMERISSCGSDMAFEIDKHHQKVKSSRRDHNQGGCQYFLLPPQKEGHAKIKHEQYEMPNKTVNKKKNFPLDFSETLEKSSKTTHFSLKIKQEQSISNVNLEKETDVTGHASDFDQIYSKMTSVREKNINHIDNEHKPKNLSEKEQNVLQCFEELRAKHKQEEIKLKKGLDDKEMHRLKKIFETEEVRLVVQAFRSDKNK